MKTRDVISATKFADGNISFLVKIEDATVPGCSVIVKDDGSLIVYAPTKPYPGKDGKTKYNRIITFSDPASMSQQVQTMLETNSENFTRFQTPVPIKGGERIGTATVTGTIVLKCTYLPENAEKPAKVLFPGREIVNGNSLEQDINNLIPKVLEIATDYVPAE